MKKISCAVCILIFCLIFSFSAYADPTGPVQKEYFGLWLWPAGNGSWNISSNAGIRNISNGSKKHHGIDISGVTSSTSVLAARDGKATYMGEVKSGRGKWVVIDHGDGWYSEYQHLSSVSFSGSKQVKAGDKIGNAGNTGGDFGVHIHFEIAYCTKGSGHTSEYNQTWSGKYEWGNSAWCVTDPGFDGKHHYTGGARYAGDVERIDRTNCTTTRKTALYGGPSTSTKKQKDLDKNVTLVIDGRKKVDGEIWYWTEAERLFINSEDVTLDETTKPIEINNKNFEFQNVTCPTNYKIGSSGGYPLSGGTLVSNEELKTITSTIKKSDGTVVSGPKTRNISGKTYNIISLDTYEHEDNGVKFSKITQSGNYIWILTATDASGKTLTLEMPFTASSNTTSSHNISKPYVPVSSVVLDKNTDTLLTGNTMTLTATVSPDNATNKGVSWSSDDTTVAAVDGNGKVTAVAPGTATIKATTADGGKTATCIITVPTSENMSPADKIRIAILNNEKYDPKLDLNNDGKINAQDYILAKKAELAPVAVPVTDIAWGTMEYKAGETGNVQYYIYPKNATNQSVYCDPYDNEICTVSVDGIIYAKKNGYSDVCIHSTENPDICVWGIICVHDPIQYSYETTVEPSGIIDIRFTAVPNNIDKLSGFKLYSENYSTHFQMQKSIIPGYNGPELKEKQNDNWGDGQIFEVDTNPRDNVIRADQEITFRLMPDNIDQLWGTQQTYSFFLLPYYQFELGHPYEKARVEVSVTVSFPEKDVPKSGIEQFVYRCYSIILSREPDAGGLKTWVNELNSGRKAASEIIDNFVRSQEFLGKKKSNADAVEILYKAMLGRGSDPAGKATWVGKLDAGHPFAVVINGFCGSKEFKEICDSYGITPGSVSMEQGSESDQQIRAFVTRCYKIILGRDPDGEGMNTWFNELKSRRRAAAEIIEQFVYSQEFQNKKYSNADAVEILYKAMLGRGSDPAGKADWVAKLNNGQPLTAIINGFCGSMEFGAICDAYGITPGSVQVQQLSSQPVVEEEPVAKQTVTKTENNVTKVEIVNPSDTENAQLGTAVQAIYINEEKAKEFIGRCYRCILGREASQAELDSWIGQMLNGTKTADQIARGFLFSGEFKDKNVSNEELVKILYRVYLNREADAEGLETWIQKLDEGTSLNELLNTFSNTNEFKAVIKNMAQ